MLNSRWLVLIAALAVAACGAVGYAIGVGSAPDASDASESEREAFIEAKRDAQQTSFEAAKRQGAKKGVAEGRRAGVRAGETSGVEAAGGDVEAELAAISEEQAAEEAAAAAAEEAATPQADSVPPPVEPGPTPQDCPDGTIWSSIPPYGCVVPGPLE